MNTSAPQPLSGVKVIDFTGPPLLGEHTIDVLSDLGYTADQIADLKTAHVI